MSPTSMMPFSWDIQATPIAYKMLLNTSKIYGPLLLDSWLYSMETGSLLTSHRSSYLRLIPKDGKDQSVLKNWRPITLSNCDIKIITKTIARKMTMNLTSIIGQNQTAYMKGRQITDNLHIMQHAIMKANEQNDDSMIVSLDAEKAFDSISHSYIKHILKHIGLEELCITFDTLYNNQHVDIVLNNQIAGSYRIKNGVKQGDALSCILFILGIEPLIRNIQCDPQIENVSYHGVNIPKILSYADDVACITKPNQNNLDRIFSHYEKMTDKTELIQRGGYNTYNIKYNGCNSTVNPAKIIKINGLNLSFDNAEANDLNLQKIFTSLEAQLRLWKNMYLSILGKITIFKTFGLSQILFIASTVLIPLKMEKKINELIYRFIWNSNLDNRKAPDRIKRSIMTTPIKLLGLGMLDFREIIKSIRIKTLLRLMNLDSHPINQMLRNSLSNSVVNIQLLYSLNPVLDNTVSELNKMWKNKIKNCGVEDRDTLYTLILNEYVGNLLLKRFQNKRQGLFHRHDKIHEILNLNPQHPILKKLDRSIYCFLMEGGSLINLKSCKLIIPTTGKILLNNDCTSKLIRSQNNPQSMTSPKILENANEDRLTKLGQSIRSLTNTKLKSILLRAIHGDIYCGTRLKKFGMSDSDMCQRCGYPENIKHLLLECDYVKQIWEICKRFTSIPIDNINAVLGDHDFHDKTTLTIHCEIIRRLLAIERPIISQHKLIKSVLNRLAIVEKGISKHTIKSFELMLVESYPVQNGGGT